MYNLQQPRMFPDKTQAGFTLLEALIAMVILVIGVLAWIGTQQSAVQNRGQSRTMTVATELVQSKIEELSLKTAEVTGSGDETYTIEGFDYTLQWKVDEMNSEGEILSYANPWWIINVEGAWNYRGEKSIEHQRVVTE